ncbi:hypothetical protein STEG23_038296 [Scotinomys teguina]
MNVDQRESWGICDNIAASPPLKTLESLPNTQKKGEKAKSCGSVREVSARPTAPRFLFSHIARFPHLFSRLCLVCSTKRRNICLHDD